LPSLKQIESALSPDTPIWLERSQDWRRLEEMVSKQRKTGNPHRCDVWEMRPFAKSSRREMSSPAAASLAGAARRRIWMLAALASLFLLRSPAAQEAPTANPDKSSLPQGKMLIEPSSAAAPLGQRARLTVSPLTRKNDGYGGQYRLDVSPLSFASEKGSLAIAISESDLRKFVRGGAILFKGRATSEKGRPRTIEGEASPAGSNAGSAKLRITSEKGTLTFDTTFRFDGKP
jgi:hypothetical protein